MEEEKMVEQVFVHDIANDLTVVDSSLNILNSLLSKTTIDQSGPEFTKLNKAREKVTNMILKLKEFRGYLHAQEKLSK